MIASEPCFLERRFELAIFVYSVTTVWATVFPMVWSQMKCFHHDILTRADTTEVYHRLSHCEIPGYDPETVFVYFVNVRFVTAALRA